MIGLHAQYVLVDYLYIQYVMVDYLKSTIRFWLITLRTFIYKWYFSQTVISFQKTMSSN